MDEQIPRPEPTTNNTNLQLEVKPDQQTAAGDLMRATGAASMTMLGGSLVLEQPTLAGKIVGSAVAAYGMREQYKSAKESSGGEVDKDSILGRMRDRFMGFASSLVDQNTGRADLAGRLKRRTGEEFQKFEDREFRIRFQRMMGGMAIFGLGAEVMEQPTSLGKALGAIMMVAGAAEFTHNQLKTHERDVELTDLNTSLS